VTNYTKSSLLGTNEVMMDQSNGYERVAAAFLAGRGRAPSTAVGTSEVRDWARTLPLGAAVIDLGCGTGLPITKVLVDEGLTVYAVDASPSLVAAFQRNLPEVPVACESVVESSFFNRTFDGVVAWGLIFLLQPEEQRQLIRRVADILLPGGRFLFTSSRGTEPLVWTDGMTDLESRSLGAAEYRKLLVRGRRRESLLRRAQRDMSESAAIDATNKTR
jgi:SAM-dependent methyltransferase